MAEAVNAALAEGFQPLGSPLHYGQPTPNILLQSMVSGRSAGVTAYALVSGDSPAALEAAVAEAILDGMTPYSTPLHYGLPSPNILLQVVLTGDPLMPDIKPDFKPEPRPPDPDKPPVIDPKPDPILPEPKTRAKRW